MWKDTRKVAREVPGFGMGKLVKWDRHSLTNYTHLRTNKGHFNQWRHKIKRAPSAMCRFCGVAEETGDHITFYCVGVDRPSIPDESGNGVRVWKDWVDLEDKVWVHKIKGGNGKPEWVDLRYKFFAELQLAPVREDEGV